MVRGPGVVALWAWGLGLAAGAGSAAERVEPRLEWKAEQSPGLWELELLLAEVGTGRAGLGVAVVWDSRRLEFAGLDGVLEAALVGRSSEPEADLKDLDGDPQTDRLVRLAWAEASGAWPGAQAGTPLARVRMRPVEDTAERWATRVAAVSLSEVPGYRFATTRLPVRLEPARSESGRRSLPAGRQIRPSAERVEAVRTLSATTVHHRSLRVGRQASTESPALCSLDVDADGLADALTDGVLILRRLFGFSGVTLVNGAVAPSAGRNDTDELDQYLRNAPCRAMQDADGNGQLDALTDGLLILRYLFGFTGDPLAAGAVGTGASRTAGTAVADWLALYLNLFATIELSAPDLEAPLYAGIPARMDVGVRYTGTLSLAFTLEQGPAGMSISEESGELRWTPQDLDEGSAPVVRVRATDQEATAEVEFALQVAESTPLGMQAVDRTVRVIEQGTLQGLAVTLGADSPSLPGDLEFGGVADPWAPPLPPGVTRLSGFFKLTGWERGEDPARVQLPLYGLPPGRFLDEVQLFVYSEALHHLGRPSWAPLGVFPELTANGEVVVDLWSLPGLAFVGLAERPETAAGSERKSRPLNKRRPDEPAHQSGITCQPHAVLLGGLELYRISEAQICDVASPPLTVWVYGYDPESITWGGGAPPLEEFVGGLRDSRTQIEGLGLEADAEFIVRFESIECGTLGGCLLGFVTPAENYVVLHLASTWREGATELAGAYTADKMFGTLAHEYFHHAQARTRVPGHTNILGISVNDWVSEGTAVWFDDEVFDDRDNFAGRLPLPSVLEAGLAAPRGLLRSPFDPYSRFAFWKMLFSETTRRCPGFELRDLFNSPVTGGDPNQDAVEHFVGRLSAWQCDFGPGFGAGESAGIGTALLRYNVAAYALDELKLLDGDETYLTAFDNAPVFSPDRAESQKQLNRNQSLYKLGAKSFLLGSSRIAYTLRISMKGGGLVRVSLLGFDPNLELEAEGWTSSTVPIVGDRNWPHVHTEVTETRTLEIKKNGERTPDLLVTVVNPATTGIADFTFEVILAGRESGELYQVDPIVNNLRFVKALAFTQGAPDTQPCRQGVNDKTFTHTLTRNLAVMETEVTRQMWADLRDAQPSLPADPTAFWEFYPIESRISLGMDNPVNGVSWRQAVLFANLLSLERGFSQVYYVDAAMTQPLTAANYQTDAVYENWTSDGFRLPSEGEWEFFTRAGTSGPFFIPEPAWTIDVCGTYCPQGVFTELEKAAWLCTNWGGAPGVGATHPVGEKLANPWNLKDVHGNVAEWVWDLYGAIYPEGFQADFRGPAASSCSGTPCRVIRGGNSVGFAWAAQSSMRSVGSSFAQSPFVGFRLVRTVE